MGLRCELEGRSCRRGLAPGFDLPLQLLNLIELGEPAQTRPYVEPARAAARRAHAWL